MTNDTMPTAVTATYYDAWRNGDLATLRSVLADDVDFLGPLARFSHADDCVQAMQGLVKTTTDLVVARSSPTARTWSLGSTCTPRARLRAPWRPSAATWD